VASNAGYGFRVQLKELLSKNKAGKLLISLPESAKVIRPTMMHNDSDFLAVITLQGRLLVFPAIDLPALSKGKGNKLIQIPSGDLTSGKDCVVAMVTLPVNGQLKIMAGKRQLTLKGLDLEHYYGSRAKRGMALPRGFQRVDDLLSE
jgi:topoisomerase IV subunit A